MTDTLNVLLVFLVGAVLGAVFFGGLWWTIQHQASSPRPALWFLLSFWLRSSVVLAGFFLVSGHHWQRWLVCLLGFVAARLVVTWLTRPSREGTRSKPSHRVSHAP